ncbi:MAG TPA: hypothetical protein VK167_07530 [Flavipsychrobacter sp.]|nr:hypothetical protein [Flavipsychrobacter sp.]
MSLKNLLSIILSLVFVNVCIAQSNKGIYIYNENKQPLNKAELILNGKTLCLSDSDGFLNLDTGLLKDNIATIYKTGYQTATVTKQNMVGVVYLKPLQNELNEFIVVDKHAELLLKSNTQDVIDYAILEDGYLVASYNINGKRKDKISLLDKYGNVEIQSYLDIEVEKIFRSCVGKYYLVHNGAIFPVIIEHENKKITTGPALPANDYALIQRCVLFKNNTYYYKFVNPNTFNVVFTKSRADEENMTPFCRLSQPDVLKASISNLAQIYEALAEGTYEGFKRARQFHYLRVLMDNLCFKDINAELFEKDDSLLVFDFDKRLIRFFLYDGSEAKTLPMAFFKNAIQNCIVVQDSKTKEFYLWSTNKQTNMLTKIDLSTGDVAATTVELENPYVENVKITGGKTCYIWKKESLMPKQLFIESIQK